MATLPDQFRTKANENAAASIALFADPEFNGNPAKQAKAIIGQVNATMYTALADMADYLRLTAGAESRMTRVAEMLKRNDAIRKAAATGDWNEYDKLLNGTSNAADSAPAGVG